MQEIKMIEGALRAMFYVRIGAVSWSSKKQQIVSLSTTKVEFIAATACACQAIWLRRILEELQFKQVEATIVFCDNNSAIKLSKNPVLHGRSKHIDVKYYFLRDFNNYGIIKFTCCCKGRLYRELIFFFFYKLISTNFSLREGVKI